MHQPAKLFYEPAVQHWLIKKKKKMIQQKKNIRNFFYCFFFFPVTKSGHWCSSRLKNNSPNLFYVSVDFVIFLCVKKTS